MFSPFRAVNHKLSNSSFDWAAKLVTTGSMSDDVTVVLVLLFSKTIRSLGCCSKFQIRTRCVIKASRSNIDRHIVKCEGLIISSGAGVFAGAHAIKEGNTDHVSNRFSFHRGRSNERVHEYSHDDRNRHWLYTTGRFVAFFPRPLLSGQTKVKSAIFIHTGVVCTHVGEPLAHRGEVV